MWLMIEAQKGAPIDWRLERVALFADPISILPKAAKRWSLPTASSWPPLCHPLMPPSCPPPSLPRKAHIDSLPTSVCPWGLIIAIYYSQFENLIRSQSTSCLPRSQHLLSYPIPLHQHMQMPWTGPLHTSRSILWARPAGGIHSSFGLPLRLPSSYSLSFIGPALEEALSKLLGLNGQYDGGHGGRNTS